MRNDFNEFTSLKYYNKFGNNKFTLKGTFLVVNNDFLYRDNDFGINKLNNGYVFYGSLNDRPNKLFKIIFQNETSDIRFLENKILLLNPKYFEKARFDGEYSSDLKEKGHILRKEFFRNQRELSKELETFETIEKLKKDKNNIQEFILKELLPINDNKDNVKILDSYILYSFTIYKDEILKNTHKLKYKNKENKIIKLSKTDYNNLLVSFTCNEEFISGKLSTKVIYLKVVPKDKTDDTIKEYKRLIKKIQKIKD